MVYGYAQTAAAYVDLAAMETQRAERFVDPHALDQAVNTALVSFDLPCAGAYERIGLDIASSWREAIDRIFRTKRVEVNSLDKTLLDLLMLLHGKPGSPATTVPVNCPHGECAAEDVPVSAAASSPIARLVNSAKRSARIREINLLVEPFAGGGSVSLRLVGAGVVDRVLLADADPLMHMPRSGRRPLPTRPTSSTGCGTSGAPTYSRAGPLR